MQLKPSALTSGFSKKHGCFIALFWLKYTRFTALFRQQKFKSLKRELACILHAGSERVYHLADFCVLRLQKKLFTKGGSDLYGNSRLPTT